MEILITASIGLCSVPERNGHKSENSQDWPKKYFMTIITADQYQFYQVEISLSEARHISAKENVEIEDLDSMPEGMHLRVLHF